MKEHVSWSENVCNKYFHIKKQFSTKAKSETNLPDPSGSLSKVIPCSTIVKVKNSVIEKAVPGNRSVQQCCLPHQSSPLIAAGNS